MLHRGRVGLRTELLVPLPVSVRSADGPGVDCEPDAHPAQRGALHRLRKCAKACPSALPVERLVPVRSAECTGCMECVAECPADGALAVTITPVKRSVPAWGVPALIAVLFMSAYGYARYMGYWNPGTSPAVYLELVPRANEFSHP